MNIKTIASVAAAAALAATVAATACASAAPAHTTRGTAHLTVYSVNSDGAHFKAIATGAVGDYGPGLTVLPNGQVDPEHRGELQLSLTHGSFRIEIGGIAKALTKAYQHWPSNSATCSGHISITATAPIVAGSGTGAYRGITGSFAMAVSIDEVDVKPVCDGTSRFLSQLVLMDGSGTVSY